MALLFVLAILVLVTTIVLLLLYIAVKDRQVSFSSSGQNRAEVLAKSAIDITEMDLVSEIQAGSTTYTTNGVSLYVPFTNFTIVPCRTVSLNYTNLIKESQGGTNFWYGSAYNAAYQAPMRASSDPSYSTLLPSIGGRYVPSSMWGKPQLLSSTPPPPSWILITRQGPVTNAAILPSMSILANNSGTNSNYVLGRYAYAIYDEGGLIDINQAGNGLNSATNSQRGRLNEAALAEIPLVDSTPGSALNTSAGSALVTWRNTTTSTNTAWMFSPTNNFINVSPGDQAFVSRQDLINYGTAQGFQSSAYQNLGVFSREANIPVYTPDPNRPKVQPVAAFTSYAWSGAAGISQTFGSGFGIGNPNSVGLDDKYNPSLTNIRDSSGNPVVKERFPLSRLSWLTYLGPIAGSGGNLNPMGDAGVGSEITIYENAGIPASYLQQGTAANIKTYFGLIWDSANNQWIYTSPDGATPSIMIKTLAAIPATRTTGPDFFETLMATISVGSIGRDAGPPGLLWEYIHNNKGASGVGSNVILQDQNVYRHILQIGANIIDQYDPDSFPTAIMMGVTGSSYTTVFGVENLPYINRVIATIYQDYDLQQSHGYLETELWNPHQSALTTPPASLIPTQIRFRAVADPDNPSSSYSAAGHSYVLTMPGKGSGSSPGVQAPIDLCGAPPIIANYSPSFAITPTLLTANNSSGGVSPAKAIYSYNTTYAQVNLYGMDAGWHSTANVPTTQTCYFVASSSTSAAQVPFNNIYIDYSPAVSPYPLDTFDLECLVGGVWRPYTVMRNVAFTTYSSERPFMTPLGGAAPGSAIFTSSCNDVGGNAQGGYVEWLHLDTRTDRFGVMERVGAASTPGDGGPFPETGRTRWSGCTGQAYYPVPLGAASNLLQYPPTLTGLSALGVTSYMPYLCASSTSPVAANIPFFMEDNYGANSGNNTLNPSASVYNPIVFSIWESSPLTFGRFMETIADNLAPPYVSAANTSLNYYEDPDGITRPGMGAYTQSGNGTDGRPMSMNSNYGAMTGTSQPIALNRPFRSVSELGYSYRDLPWKDIDFFSTVSGDAALLEAFSIDDTTAAVTGGTVPIVAGKVNLNSQNTTALQAMIFGAIRDDTSNATSNTISQSDAASIAQALVTRTSSAVAGSGPLSTKADLVLKFSGDLNTPLYASNSDAVIKRRREAAIRALSDAGTTRTWNLMVDIITQAGKYTKASTTGDQFVVEGERHYWLHLALDRITGRVIDEFLEPVND